MIFEDLETLPATANEYHSRMILAAVYNEQDWLCYSGSNDITIRYLMRRYLTSHARIMGVFTPTLCGAQKPLSVIRFKPDKDIQKKNLNNMGQKKAFKKIDLVEGATFLNGAVIRISYVDTENFVLFISRDDAEFWGYPTKGQMKISFEENKSP